MQPLVLFFGDGPHTFQLKLGQIRELQRKCDAGIGVIIERVLSGHYYIEDISETIRLGLIGGGMSPHGSAQMVEDYVNGQPLAGEAGPYMTAQAVLMALITAVKEAREEDAEEGEEESLPGEAGAAASR